MELVAKLTEPEMHSLAISSLERDAYSVERPHFDDLPRYPRFRMTEPDGTIVQVLSVVTRKDRWTLRRLPNGEWPRFFYGIDRIITSNVIDMRIDFTLHLAEPVVAEYKKAIEDAKENVQIDFALYDSIYMCPLPLTIDSLDGLAAVRSWLHARTGWAFHPKARLHISYS